MSDPSHRLTKWSGQPARYKTIDGKTIDTIVTGHLTSEQFDAYLQYFRIEEISDLLRLSNKKRVGVLLLLPSGNRQENPNLKRDPSPPPKYDIHGNRVNTRDSLMGLSLENERHYLALKVSASVKNYMSPLDYHKPAKIYEKLYIPLKDYPDINFVGLLLGPRGNTLRQIQDDSGAKLAIRGKGSVKDGKSSGNVVTESEESGALMSPASFANPHVDNNSEDLHVVITADSSKKIEKAIMFANEIVEKAISSPMGQNDLKRGQLRELAILNGTLRESRPFVPEEQKQKGPGLDISLIVCLVCGKVGHFARDCKFKHYDDNIQERSYLPPERLLGRPTEPEPAPYGYQPLHSQNPRQREDDSSLPPWKRHKPELPPWQSQEPYRSHPRHPVQSRFFPSEDSTESHTPVQGTKPKPPPGIPLGDRPLHSGASKPPPPSFPKPPPPSAKPAPPPKPAPPAPSKNKPPPPS